jgi:hypothetical protein
MLAGNALARGHFRNHLARNLRPSDTLHVAYLCSLIIGTVAATRY